MRSNFFLFPQMCFYFEGVCNFRFADSEQPTAEHFYQLTASHITHKKDQHSPPLQLFRYETSKPLQLDTFAVVSCSLGHNCAIHNIFYGHVVIMQNTCIFICGSF